MSPYIARLTSEELGQNYSTGYSANPIKRNQSVVVEGNFSTEEPMSIKAIVTRKINKSIGVLLIMTIMVTFVSYYISMIYEAKLNVLDSNIVRLNTENQDLQAEIDRYKSFTNVDNKMGEFGNLKKAEKVLEVTALDATDLKQKDNNIKTATGDFNWAVGY